MPPVLLALPSPPEDIIIGSPPLAMAVPPLGWAFVPPEAMFWPPPLPELPSALTHRSERHSRPASQLPSLRQGPRSLPSSMAGEYAATPEPLQLARAFKPTPMSSTATA